MKPETTFRIVHFVEARAYVGMAWNYTCAVILATAPHATYAGARDALDRLAWQRNVELKWFDGQYRVEAGSDQMLPLA